MNNYSDIGFSVSSENEYFKLAEMVFEIGHSIKVKGGRYINYTDPSGAELWLQVDNENHLLGMNPHYNSYIKSVVCLTERFSNNANNFDELYTGWFNPSEKNNPDSGMFPFVFDMPDAKTNNELSLPQDRIVQLSAFAQNLSLYGSEEEFDKLQSSDPKFASQSFIPTGLFTQEFESKEFPEALCFFTGIIKDHKIKQNVFSNNSFHWFLVDTLGGIIDVVADPGHINAEPVIGGVINGDFWVSGKLQ